MLVEDTDARTRHSKVFRDTQKKERVHEFGKNRHYFRYGAWRDLDLSLNAKGGSRYLADGADVVLDADSTGLAVYDYSSEKGIRFLFPRPPDRVTGRSAFWTNAGVEWEFTLGRGGLKTKATVAAKRGPRTYSFDGQMLGGLAPPNPDAGGNLVQPAGIFTMPRSFAKGADGIRYDCGPWTRTGGTVSFDFDDTNLPAAALPYVIDPTTTFTVAPSGDGTATRSDTAYPPAGAIVTGTTDPELSVRREFIAQWYYVFVVLLRWDTSSLFDDATVLSATLRLHTSETGISDVDSRSLTVEWYDAGTIGAEDYAATAVGDAHAGTALSAIVPSADNDFALLAPTSVNLTGYTGLRLHISGGVPSGSNIVDFASSEHATLPEPMLLVTTADVEFATSDAVVHTSRREV